jgi:hypothetical protein
VKKIPNLQAIFFVLVVVLHIAILLDIHFFPYPELFVYPYLTAKGLVPYKQIFDQHFPGLMFFPINLYTLGMTDPLIARFWHVSVVAITHVFIFFISKKLLKLGKWSIAPNIAYAIWQPYLEGYVLWIDSFTPLLLLPSYLLLNKSVSGKRINLFWPGLLLGLALIMKQVLIVVIAGVFIYLLVKKVKTSKIVLFSTGVAIPFIFMLLYFTKLGVLQDFYYWTVTFNLTTFSEMGRKIPTLTGLLKVSVVFAPALMYLTYELFWLRDGKNILLFIFFITSFVFAYARFDFVHLQPSLVFAVLIYGIVCQKISKGFVAPTATLYILFSLSLIIPFYKVAAGSDVFYYGNFENQLERVVSKYAGVNDSVFAMATTPHLYELTNTLPPGSVFAFPFPWFMVEAESSILKGMEKDPPEVIVADYHASVQGMNLVSYMPEIKAYVEENYKVVDNIQDTIILVPK